MKIRLLLGVLVVAGIMGSLGRVADASIVLNYTFNDKGEAQLVSVESAMAHAIRMSIRGGDDLLAVLDGNRLSVLRVGPLNATTADAAFADEAYLTFSFETSPESGTEARSLEFRVRKRGGSGQFGCLVQSSVDGFGSGRPVLLTNPTVTENSDSIHYYSVDLSNAKFQDLAEVDFRVYFYSSDTEEVLEFDGVRLNGKVIVAPEPGSSLVWVLMLATVFFVVVAAWTARRNRATLSYAMQGNNQVSTTTGHEPWSDRTRSAIFDIIGRGRIG